MDPRVTPSPPLRPPELASAYRLAAVVCCLAFVGCDQFATVGVLKPEIENAGAGAPALPDGEAGAAAALDAAMGNDAGTTNDAGNANDAGATCAPVEVAVCNPVTNEGCSAALGMQCAVDFLAPLTGYCIFYSSDAYIIGAECFNSGVTESCTPTSTCFQERCRKLCLCDADCEAGQCCTEPLEATGFKVCGDC